MNNKDVLSINSTISNLNSKGLNAQALLFLIKLKKELNKKNDEIKEFYVNLQKETNIVLTESNGNTCVDLKATGKANFPQMNEKDFVEKGKEVYSVFLETEKKFLDQEVELGVTTSEEVLIEIAHENNISIEILTVLSDSIIK